MKKVKLFFKRIGKKYIIICLLSLVIFVLLLFVVLAHYYIKVPYAIFIKKMFYQNGKFDPASITALAALLGLFVTTVASIHGIKMNIINTERTRWLSNHKKVMAEYIQQAMFYINCVSVLASSKSLQLEDNKFEDYNKMAIDAIFSFQEKFYLLNLELSPHNFENKQLLDAILNVNSCINGIKKKFIDDNRQLTIVMPSDVGDIEEFSNATAAITDLTEIARKYYREVWKQIKE